MEILLPKLARFDVDKLVINNPDLIIARCCDSIFITKSDESYLLSIRLFSDGERFDIAIVTSSFVVLTSCSDSITIMTLDSNFCKNILEFLIERMEKDISDEDFGKILITLGESFCRIVEGWPNTIKQANRPLEKIDFLKSSRMTKKEELVSSESKSVTTEVKNETDSKGDEVEVTITTEVVETVDPPSPKK